MQSGRYPYTGSLLALAACTPVTARVHCGNWGKIVSPMRVSSWERGLAGHPDREFADYICRGVREGFRVGFDYRKCKCKVAQGNMKSVQDHKEVVESYLREERESGRVLGPFRRDLMPEVHVSPFGVIPKSEPGKWRLIVNLSAPEGGSVNDGISREMCSLSYLSIDEVVSWVLRLGRGALMAKFDLRAAYRNVPVHPDDRHLLGMVWDDQLFVDTVLPFGLRSAPMIFNAVADALEFIIRELGVGWLGHYLDDFVVVGPPKVVDCGRDLGVALETCKEVGLPVAGEKTYGPAVVIPLLGIELDSQEMVLRLPQEKLLKLRTLVAKWRKRKCCTKRELQSLAGHLSHACKVVRPGRRFLRGVFGLISQFGRQDHRIRLNGAFRADLEWWHVFVGSWNGVSMMLRENLQSPEVEIWSDASGSWGCGALWGTQWCQVAWKGWPGFASASIAAKELLPIVVAVAVWGSAWKGATVLCHCDNQAVVAAIRGGYCRDPAMAHMLRCLFFLEAKFEVVLTAVHVPGVDNGPADAISRNKLDMFFGLVPQAHRVACQLPVGLVDRLVAQGQWTSEDWRGWLESLSMHQ